MPLVASYPNSAPEHGANSNACSRPTASTCAVAFLSFPTVESSRGGQTVDVLLCRLTGSSRFESWLACIDCRAAPLHKTATSTSRAASTNIRQTHNHPRCLQLLQRAECQVNRPSTKVGSVKENSKPYQSVAHCFTAKMGAMMGGSMHAHCSRI